MELATIARGRAREAKKIAIWDLLIVHPGETT